MCIINKKKKCTSNSKKKNKSELQACCDCPPVNRFLIHEIPNMSLVFRLSISIFANSCSHSFILSSLSFGAKLPSDERLDDVLLVRQPLVLEQVVVVPGLLLPLGMVVILGEDEKMLPTIPLLLLEGSL